MSALFYLIETVTVFYIMILLLRIWMQWVRADFYNPFAQFVVKITQPVVAPVRRIIPAIGQLDTASLLIAYAVAVFKVFYLNISSDILILFYALLLLLKIAGQTIFWLLLIRSILSWVSRGNHPAEYLLYQLTEPLMSPIRRIIPPMGGLDFSVMILFFVLFFLNRFAVDIFGSIWLYLK